MLDNETKRRIDVARDILVGKVPDPKSQVEQITIALVYKFMDDMDKEAIELGGKPRFFTGDYERYAWNKMFDPHIDGHQMLSIYREAIVKLNQNPNLPQLFRDIFKNAYLPYRDPETLKLFLKTINEFSYDHSERFGDAFEYLLSVLGSQGDAGQFRTPCHIIDFMVKIVNPQKHETVLDPACGTAGFLISAYKHILRENTSSKFKDYNGSNGSYRGDLLTVDERKKLFKNFKGYDISPDMVRLSLVNMYLHGFVQPQIVEYDTLTSEDYWNEYADVILANPPFMSPKGGIRPHKKFSVQSNRSEVLFVDYIVEHLTLTGRAAVIVPEGIIFHSATAYKALRKMLVENYLYVVVSLPAGVFNPYSVVKTSILFLNRQLAKKTDSILFIKIENDGFDLGAQRRQIYKNDLPDAVDVIKDYVTTIRNGKSETFVAEEKPCGALLVKKEKLAENGEYNLTGDRYRAVVVRKHQKWPFMRVDEVGKYRVSRIQTISDGTIDLEKTKWTNDEVSENDFLQEGDILLSHINSMDHLAKTALFTNVHEKVIHGINLIRLRPDTSCINPFFASLVLKSDHFINKACSFAQKAANQASIKTEDLKAIQVPLPPIEVQREIVAEIEGYQKLIDGCSQVVGAWKPDIEEYLDEELKHYLNEHPERHPELVEDWPMMKLEEVCDIKNGGTPSTNETSYYKNGKISWLKSEVCKNEIIEKASTFITEEGLKNSSAKMLKPNSTLIALVGATIGKTGFITFKASTHQNVAGLYPLDTKILSDKFLFYSSQTLYQHFLNLRNGNFKMASLSFVKSLQIPLPPLEVQQRIVARIEAEHKVIDGCRELIKTYEEKIKHVNEKVWEGF